MIDIISKILRKLFRKPLKIGLVSYYYIPEGAKAPSGGVGMHVYHLAKNLVELGNEVHVFTIGNKDKTFRKKIKEGKLYVHRLNITTTDVKDIVVAGRLKLYVFGSRALNKIIYENSKRKFDIIHTQRWPSTAFLLKHFNNLDLNWVHTFHALDTKVRKLMTLEDRKVTRIHEWVDRTVYDADRVIAVSNRSREDVIKTFRGISKKTVVIPNGVDLDVFKPSKKSPPVVFWIGRFSKEKGIGLIPEIVERVLRKSKRYKFIMVAPKTPKIEKFPELAEIKNKVEELSKKYKNRFIWIDESLSSEELRELHEKAGVYVQPSLYENAPLTVLEAMACGEAIVATKVGGMPEQLGKAGLIAKVDAKDISNKILRLLKNKDLRKKYSKLASERAKQFSWMNTAKQTLELYREIINENKIRKKEE